MSTIVPTYEGSKKDTRLRHGKGKYTYQYTGFSYNGDWNDGVKHGFGTMKLPDGSTFVGDFVEGEMTGKGKRTYPSGASYEGDFFRGEHHGHGVFTYPDGSVYDGSWCEKKRWGEGVLKFANGDLFEGHFEYHHYHGLSKFTSHDGSVFEGDFEKGMRQGHGIEKGCDGSNYEGDWKEDKRNGLGRFQGVGEIVYEGEWGDGKALDASEFVSFENMTANKLIVHKGSALPNLTVRCYYKNRDLPPPEVTDLANENPEEGGEPETAPVAAVPIPGTPVGGKLPSGGRSLQGTLNNANKESGLGLFAGGLADVVMSVQEPPPAELKVTKESGRCLQLTLKPIKLKKTSESEASDVSETSSPNVDLFVNRGTLSDAAAGLLPCAIPRLVEAANKIVPHPLSLNHLLGTVDSRHPGGAIAKYQFPPITDLERLDEDKKANSTRRFEADKDVHEANQLIGEEAAEASMKSSIAKAKSSGVELDLEFAQLKAEDASIKAVAKSLKKKGRFALAGKAVMTDVLKSRRLLPIGQLDSRFIEKKEEEKSAEMILAEEDDDEEEKNEKINEDGFKEGDEDGSETGDVNRDGGEVGDEASVESSVHLDSWGEAGDVTCKVLEPQESCWTGGVVVDTKVTKFVDAVHAAFAAKTPAGRAAAAGAVSLCFDFWINAPTIIKEMQTNKPQSITLVNSDILTIKLVSDPCLPSGESDVVPASNARSRKRGSLAMARADKQAKQRIERSPFIRAKIVVTLVGVGDVETVVLDVPNLKTRMPPAPAPNAQEAAKIAAQACISYHSPPNAAALLPQVGGSYYGAWHSIVLVINPKSSSEFYGDDQSLSPSSASSSNVSFIQNHHHNNNNNQSGDLEHETCNELFLNVFLDGDQLKHVPPSNTVNQGKNTNLFVESESSKNENIHQQTGKNLTNNQLPGLIDVNHEEYGVLIRDDFPWCLTTAGGLKRSPCAFNFMDDGGSPYGCGLSSFVIYDDVLDSLTASKVSGCYSAWRALEIVAQEDSSKLVESLLDHWRAEHPPKDPAVVRAEYEAKKERAIKRLEEKKKAEEAKAAKNKKKDTGKGNDKKNDEKEKAKLLQQEKKAARRKSGIENGERKAEDEEDEDEDDDDLEDEEGSEEEGKKEEDELEFSEDERSDVEPPTLPEIVVGSSIASSRTVLTLRGSAVFRGLNLPSSTPPGEYELALSDVTFDNLKSSPRDSCGVLLQPLPPISLKVVVPNSD